MAPQIDRILLLVAVLLTLSIPHTTAISAPPIRYSDLCASIVPQSPPVAPVPAKNISFFFDSGYFTGADEFLSAPQKLISFRPVRIYSTESPGTLRLEASLTLRAVANPRGRSLRHVVSLPRRRPLWRSVKLSLSGFWSESSGRMCLVGGGVGRSGEGTSCDVSAVFKLNCTRSSDISNSFVSGILESLDDKGSSGYFSPVAMMVYVERDYVYRKIPQVTKMDLESGSVGDPLRFGSDVEVCSLLKSIGDAGGLELEYGPACRDRNCSPFDANDLPRMVFLRDVQCDGNGRLHFNMLFSNENYRSQQFDPARAMVSEGFWDRDRSRFFMVACRLKNLTTFATTDGAIGDCGIRVSLWFPRYLTVKIRSLLVGQIWSINGKNDSGYFETVSVHNSDHYVGVIPGLKYNFTEIVDFAQTCPSTNLNKSTGDSYPDRSTFRDMTFHFSVKDSAGKIFPGSMFLFSISETIYDRYFSEDGALPSSMLAGMNHTSWNVSYKIMFPYQGSSKIFSEQLFDISAEGVYDIRTGKLCLMGCRDLPSNGKKVTKSMNSTDCDILINVQLPSLNRIGETHLTGSIRSTRNIKDPLYFKPMEISSHVMYHNDVAQTLWRMDIEITMVLISLTLSCIFIGSQLFYVKNSPEVLPNISITMLLFLTLGHMIPLMLNFDALFFMNHNKQNVVLSNGGWLEANEVMVRIVTMIAFLLQFRLLQITWSARSAEENKKELWIAERRSINICLPLYFIGIVTAWLFNLGSYKSKAQPIIGAHNHDSRWGDLMVFSGLVLDAFLLPQILFNMFWDSKEKSLTPMYYIGTTSIRALPHIYDAYRAHGHMGRFVPTYVYASPGEDFFSTAWDIFIPCGGFIFVIIIFLQQKFGGRSILPSRFRKSGGYVVVSVYTG